MSDYIERACTNCGSLLHHEDRCSDVETYSSASMDTKPIVRCSKMRLTASERKIYEAVMSAFPATSHESALNVAVQGGVKWDFRAT